MILCVTHTTSNLTIKNNTKWYFEIEVGQISGIWIIGYGKSDREEKKENGEMDPERL